MRVCVVTEFYPRRHDPVLGIWAHRQAVAARDAGADVRVVVLHRPIPPLSTPRAELPGAALELLRQPRRAVLEGLEVTYVRFVAPPRPSSYGDWGRWAARPLARALRRLRREFPFDVVHAHNAVPAGEAVRRADLTAPLVVSVHGGDVYWTAPRFEAGREAVRATFGAARIVLANSHGTARMAAALGAARTRVVRLGTDLPAIAELPAKLPRPTLVTVAHLVARKRHADVLRALWVLRDRHPDVRYLVIGDGPEREPLRRLAAELGLADRVEFTGQLPQPDALRRARAAHLFVLPSVDEAFGVAYVEAMAGGLPVIGALGEPGPQEIAHAGPGIRLVAPGDVEQLSAALDDLLSDRRVRETLGASARRTVEEAFTWSACGAATVAAYGEALR